MSGLTGLVRLRDEETWCRLALDSFVGWCDELVVVTNTCTDRTPDIVERFRSDHLGKVRVYDYPYRIHPMGPGHAKCSVDNPHSSAALYNFTQSKATTSHVIKLDGDMVMQDWAGTEIRQLMSDGHHRIKLFGTDIVGEELRHIGCHPLCPTNGVYQKAGSHYVQGEVTQSLRGVPHATAKVQDCFVHLKWSRKSLASATAQWPVNWRDIPHFQRIIERRNPVALYTGAYPRSLRALL